MLDPAVNPWLSPATMIGSGGESEERGMLEEVLLTFDHPYYWTDHSSLGLGRAGSLESSVPLGITVHSSYKPDRKLSSLLGIVYQVAVD